MKTSKRSPYRENKESHDAAQKRWNNKNFQKFKLYRKKWKLENKDKVRQHRKKWNDKNKFLLKNYSLKIKYGIDLHAYNKILHSQKGVCAICENADSSKCGNILRSLSVDHCHKTLRVRGLLCYRCNTGIGLFLEKIELLDRAKEYLLKCSNL